MAIVVAVLIGFFEGALFFSDPGPGETLAVRLVVAISLAISAGLLFGYNLRRLWFLSVLSAWMPLLFFIFSLPEMAHSPAESALETASLLSPAVAALAAGWFGSNLKAAKNLILMVLTGVFAVAGAFVYLGARP